MGISQIFPENLGGGQISCNTRSQDSSCYYFFFKTQKKFDGESFESKTNTEAINNKDFAGQWSVAQPYQFELVCDE